MLCPNCQSEQHGSKFCTVCGTKLAVQGKPEQPQSQLGEPEEQTPSPLAASEGEPQAIAETEAGKTTAGKTAAAADPPQAEAVQQSPAVQVRRKPIIYMLLGPTLLSIAVTLCAAGAGFFARKSEFIQDYLYLWFHSIASPDIALRIAADKSVGFWEMAVFTHLGTINGSITNSAFPEQPVAAEFSLYLPIIAFPLFLVIITALLMRIGWNRLLPKERSARIGILLASSVVYGVIISVLLFVFAPSITWESGNRGGVYVYKQGISFLEIWCKAAGLYLVSGLLAGVVPFPKGNWQVPFKRFVFMLSGIVLGIGALMVAVWALSDPLSAYRAPITTLGSLWLEYKADPAYYGLLPTMLIQELLFAIGGTWSLNGSHASEWLQISPLRFHILSGGSLADVARADAARIEWMKQVGAMIRTTWHPYALLIGVIYSMLQLKANASWKQVIVFTSLWGLLCMLLAHVTTVRLNVDQQIERIGFASNQVLFFALGLGLVVFMITYGVRHLRSKGRMNVE